MTECQFADDSALLATTRAGAERCASGYQMTSSEFGLQASLPKTKQMMTGRMVEDRDRGGVSLDRGDVEVVNEFPYLGSVVEDTGRMDVEVSRYPRRQRPLGVFLDRNLSLAIKRKIYDACVLSVLL